MESGWCIVATRTEKELQVKDDLVGPKTSSEYVLFSFMQ